VDRCSQERTRTLDPLLLICGGSPILLASATIAQPAAAFENPSDSAPQLPMPTLLILQLGGIQWPFFGPISFPIDFCGNGLCSATEDATSCPADCGHCGDGVCTFVEDASSCFVDCCKSVVCGNQICECDEASWCPLDCFCGDKVCDPTKGETSATCPMDCCLSAVCDDAKCDKQCGEADWETGQACIEDCHCGNGACEPGYKESFKSCPSDCHCGDGFCQGPLPETDVSCPEDCCKLDVCGDGKCTQSCLETLLNCSKDCKACGDSVCTWPTEDANTCPADCCKGNGGCGDGICAGKWCIGFEEDPDSCPNDCNPSGCGDKICSKTEDPTNCEIDCEWQICGNGVCEPFDGGPDACPADCSTACGDGTCEGGESFQTCKVDCPWCGDGVCSTKPGDPFSEDICTCPIDCVPLLKLDTPQCIWGQPSWNSKCCQWFEAGWVPTCNLVACTTGGPAQCVVPAFYDACPGTCQASQCGNDICSANESAASCPDDCNLSDQGVAKPGSCGDGTCSPKDLKDGCDLDCALTFYVPDPNNPAQVAPPLYCGDGDCTGVEAAKNCPADCSIVPVIQPTSQVGTCDNGVCEFGETPQNCYTDCSGGPGAACPNGSCTCGDGICTAWESADCPQQCSTTLSAFWVDCKDCQLTPGEFCFADCMTMSSTYVVGSLCGDLTCESKEVAATCPKDCGPNCGDGECTLFETPTLCPVDCNKTCGDAMCNWGETTVTCPEDCTPPVCGDGTCDSNESASNTPGKVLCTADCGPTCGDGECSGSENFETCPWDCPLCGDGVCAPAERPTAACAATALVDLVGCLADVGNGSGFFNCLSDVLTVQVCGQCMAFCPADCWPACGNGLCEATEDQCDCPQDCDGTKDCDGPQGLRRPPRIAVSSECDINTNDQCGAPNERRASNVPLHTRLRVLRRWAGPARSVLQFAPTRIVSLKDRRRIQRRSG